MSLVMRAAVYPPNEVIQTTDLHVLMRGIVMTVPPAPKRTSKTLSNADAAVLQSQVNTNAAEASDEPHTSPKPTTAVVSSESDYEGRMASSLAGFQLDPSFNARVISRGGTWGEDMILEDQTFAVKEHARSLTYVDVFSISRGELFEIVSWFPSMQRIVRRAALMKAFMRRAKHLKVLFQELHDSYMASVDGSVTSPRNTPATPRTPATVNRTFDETYTDPSPTPVIRVPGSPAASESPRVAVSRSTPPPPAKPIAARPRPSVTGASSVQLNPTSRQHTPTNSVGGFHRKSIASHCGSQGSPLSREAFAATSSTPSPSVEHARTPSRFHFAEESDELPGEEGPTGSKLDEEMSRIPAGDVWIASPDGSPAEEPISTPRAGPYQDSTVEGGSSGGEAGVPPAGAAEDVGVEAGEDGGDGEGGDSEPYMTRAEVQALLQAFQDKVKVKVRWFVSRACGERSVRFGIVCIRLRCVCELQLNVVTPHPLVCVLCMHGDRWPRR